jgi:ribosome maturation factor RimP
MELEEVSIRKAGRRSQVVVVVDGDVVDSDNLAELSRRVSGRLDELDLLGDTPFTLEVTSRGVSRPLTLPRHWRRNIGRLVQVHLVGGSSVSGRITAADEATATVDDMVVPLADVARAVVQVEFTDGGGDDGH